MPLLESDSAGRGPHPHSGCTARRVAVNPRKRGSSTPLVPRSVPALWVTAPRARSTSLYRVRPPTPPLRIHSRVCRQDNVTSSGERAMTGSPSAPKPRSARRHNGRRGNHEGGIYRRKSDGLWCASVTVAGGRRKVLYGKTREEVAAKLTVALSDVQKGLTLPSMASRSVRFSINGSQMWSCSETVRARRTATNSTSAST